MINFSIGDLTLISNSQPTTGYILQQPLKGFEQPPHRTNTYANPGENGGVVSSAFYDPRIITLVGVVYADNGSDYEARRQALWKACKINKDDSGFPVTTRISFTTMSGKNYYVNAIIDQPVSALDNPNSSRFMIQMVCPNPFIFAQSKVSTGSITPASGGGFILPVILPIVSSPGTGGNVTITNSGDETAYPTITLTGKLTNPYLYNSSAGKYLQLDYTINTGDVVVIDMAKKTIILNSSASLLSTKTNSSDWWGILSGSNQISLSTISTGDTGSAVVEFYDTYLGV